MVSTVLAAIVRPMLRSEAFDPEQDLQTYIIVKGFGLRPGVVADLPELKFFQTPGARPLKDGTLARVNTQCEVELKWAELVRDFFPGNLLEPFTGDNKDLCDWDTLLKEIRPAKLTGKEPLVWAGIRVQPIAEDDPDDVVFEKRFADAVRILMYSEDSVIRVLLATTRQKQLKIDVGWLRSHVTTIIHSVNQTSGLFARFMNLLDYFDIHKHTKILLGDAAEEIQDLIPGKPIFCVEHTRSY